MKKVIQHVFRLIACTLMLAGLHLSVFAQTTDEKPVIIFRTSIYDTYGEQNAFSFVIGTTENTYIDVDCGFGSVECQVEPAVFDSETQSIKGTTVTCKVSKEGIVKVYGDASLIDYFDASGCYIREIEFGSLTNLDILALEHNELEQIDLSPFTKLASLNISDNPFNVKPLDVGKNKPGLMILDMNIIGDVSADFDIANYPSLVTFSAWNCKNMAHLDPTKCPDLVRMSVDVTAISSLDVSKNAKLQILNISDTRITSIDLSKNTELREFYCSHQSGTVNTDVKLSSIDLTHNTKLLHLFCAGNNLTNLDLTNCSELFTLSARYNKLSSIDLSKNTGLYSVDLAYNDMDFSTLPLDPGTWNEYYYEQNEFLVDKSYPVGAVIDLSSRVLREGTQTYAKLYHYVKTNPNNSTPLDESYYTYADGKLTLLKEYTADSLYVVFSNSAFPAYSLSTKRFKVKKAEDYGKPDRTVTINAGIQNGGQVSFGIGIAGATETDRKEFYVDFGDGDRKTFYATTSGIPAQDNVTGAKSGSGSMSVWVPEGTYVTAINSEMPLYGIDLKEVPLLQYLRLADGGLYEIDLGQNRYLRMLDLSGNNLSKLSLKGVTALYNKSLLTDINMSRNNLDAFEIEENSSMRSLDISHNRFSELLLNEAVNLEKINISHNDLTTLNLAYCSKLTDADLSFNRLASIIFPEEENNIKRLAVNGNCFTFATLPQPGSMSLENYVYAPQHVISIPTKAPGINLSEQAVTVDGHTTAFVWKDMQGNVMTAGTDYDIVNGKTTFKNLEMGTIHCEMTNAAFPDMSGENALKTTPVLAAGMPTNLLATFVTPVGGQNAALSLAATDNSTALYIDWTGGDDLSQYMLKDTYTLFSAKTTKDAVVKVYTYDEAEKIKVFSVGGVTMSSMDASKMKDLTLFSVTDAGLENVTLPESAELRELYLEGNSLESIDLSKYSKLSSLSLTGNKFSTFDLSKYPSLSMVSLARNSLTSVKLGNPLLWMLDLAGNEFADITVDNVPELEHLSLAANHLTAVNLGNLPKLRILYLDDNKLDFASLPRRKPEYSLYTYKNQAVINIEEIDGKIDLSRQKDVDGTATDYKWYLDMPQMNENGELEGEELYVDDEYLLTDGVTTFLKPFSNVVCVMTNGQFPGLYLYTPMMNVQGTTGIGGVYAGGSDIKVSLDANRITVSAPSDEKVVLYTSDGKVASSARVAGGVAVIDNVKPGLYVLTVGKKPYKLCVR